MKLAKKKLVGSQGRPVGRPEREAGGLHLPINFSGIKCKNANRLCGLFWGAPLNWGLFVPPQAMHQCNVMATEPGECYLSWLSTNLSADKQYINLISLHLLQNPSTFGDSLCTGNAGHTGHMGHWLPRGSLFWGINGAQRMHNVMCSGRYVGFRYLWWYFVGFVFFNTFGILQQTREFVSRVESGLFNNCYKWMRYFFYFPLGNCAFLQWCVRNISLYPLYLYYWLCRN